MKAILAIVIPAYNEAQRLPRTLKALEEITLVQELPWDLRLVFVVNDGSRDETQDVILQWKKKWPLCELVSLPKNCGKGAAVREGLRAALGKSDWTLVADADESTPWSELLPLAKVREEFPAAWMIFGSRAHEDARIEIHQPWYREAMGKIFNFILRCLSGVHFRDTQCGFKLLRNDERLAKLLPRLSVDRFAWDVEFFMFAHLLGYVTIELPIRWRHMNESRVNPVKDGVEMLVTILRLRIRTFFLKKE